MLSFNWKRAVYLVISLILLFSTIVPSGVKSAYAASPIKAESITAGGDSSLVLKSDGSIVGWGNNSFDKLSFPVGLSEVVAIELGGNHTLALKSDGTVVSWGYNHSGQTSVPVGLKDVVSIVAGDIHSLALKSDGTVVAWGLNTSGQANVPAGLDGVVKITAGNNHSLALKSDGIVVAWGSSSNNVPVGLDGVVSIAAGEVIRLHWKSDGTVVAWGGNTFGQTNVPATLDGVVEVAAGANHSLALKSDGTVVVWGFNASGQANVPAGLDGVAAITAGYNHSLALKSDGTVVAWGNNGAGLTNVPGNANLSSLTLQEGDFTESFAPSVTDYTYYYDGQSLSSVHVTPTLANANQTALYVDGELLNEGSTKMINLSGATTNTVILVRVEPYLLPGQTYTITLAIDSTPPEVQFGTNGRVVAGKTAASSVTISDTQSGIDATSLHYVWTQSTSVPTSGWLSFSDGDTLSQTSGDGNWYLHIRATDNVGNVTQAVSNPFVLDNTAPNAAVSSSASGTVNAAFPVMITFSEDVSGFTSDELMVVNGIASDFVSVNATTYTATITPLTSGQAVTVSVEAAAATDVVGHDNTASNTLSLLYDTTKPVVTFGGFMDHQQFASPPTEVFASVSESVYWIVDDAPLISANALPLISMKKDGQDYSDYMPSYDESSRTFTLTFNNALIDGDYEVLVAGNVVKNQNQNILDAVQANFTVAVPVVASMTTNPTSITSTGGSAIVSLTGTNLIGQTIAIYVDGVQAATANITSDGSAEATVLLPQNLTTRAIEHRLTVYLNGIEVADQFSTITVRAIPSVPSRSPSISQSNDADLAKLKVYISGKALELTPNFTSGINHYTLETDAGQVELELSSADSKAVIKLQGEHISGKQNVPLVVGANVLNITVQAEDGTINTYTLTMNRIPNHDTPTAPVCPFTDIDNHWAQSAICEAAALGIVEGVNNDTFVPNGYVTRTEFAVMLMRTLQIPISNHSSELSFSDKESIPEWARLTIQTAVVKGILQGYTDGTLRAERTVSRTEMAAMVSKVMNWKASSADIPYFSDDASIPTWAKTYVEAARKNGLLKGREGNQFVPDGRTTRAEATVVLLRLWKSIH